MEDFEVFGAWFALMAVGWGVVTIIVTFKVWIACNRITEIAADVRKMISDNYAAATAIHAELQKLNQGGQ